MGDATADYQALLDGLRRRDAGAVQALVARAYDRLRRLAAKMLRESYPRVAEVRELDSVVSEAYLRLAKALEAVDLPTPDDFFRFAAHKIRQTLLDMADEASRQARRGGDGPGGREVRMGDDSTASGAGFDPGTTTLDPAKLAELTELHRRVDELPEDVKGVFVQHYYLALSQAEIAAATGLTPKQVSRLWLEAVRQLGKYLTADA